MSKITTKWPSKIIQKLANFLAQILFRLLQNISRNDVGPDPVGRPPAAEGEERRKVQDRAAGLREPHPELRISGNLKSEDFRSRMGQFSSR